jgi:uncharacterized protein YqgC (DUF456 family)
MTGTTIICGLLVVVGLFGILVPVLPGTVLVLLGFLVWASEKGTAEAWTVFALAALILAAGTVVKYAVPGRRLKASVPTSTLVVGGLLVVGFFVIPVVGMLVGFPIGVYAAERVRVGGAGAWPSTKAALRALAHSILIELVAALLATAVWIVGVAIS